MTSFFLVASCTATLNSTASNGNYNVTNFGAKADGKTDDSQAIISCINYAIRHNNGIVKIPAGKYYISKPLVFDQITSNQPLILLGTGATIFSDKLLNHFFYFKTSISTAEIQMKGLAIKGKLTQKRINKLFDKSWFSSGLTFKGINRIKVEDCLIKDIYGGGIHIYSQQIKKISDIKTKANIVISNNRIENVFGFKPSRERVNGKLGRHDFYGDGISIQGGYNGIIENNDIINNLDFTKHLGRAGIVLETATYNYVLRGNKIIGYDRGVHIESSFGGHKLFNNTISGISTGIVISAGKRKMEGLINREISIENNYVTNENLPLNIRTLLRPAALLLFYGNSKYYNNSIVQNNTFKSNQKMNVNNYILLIQQANLLIRNNKILGAYDNKPNILLNRGAKEFSENELVDLGSVVTQSKIPKSKGNKAISIKRSNFIK